MKHSYFFAILVMTLASCNGGLDEPGTLGEPVAAEVAAHIGSASRAVGTSWGEDDRIGISGTSGTTAYANEEYRIADKTTGSFTATGSGIFYQTTAEVAFTAYYPFTGAEGTAQTSITGNTRADNQTAAAQPGIDYLWAQATGSYKKPVNFSFSHKMSRLSLTFVSGDCIDVSDMTSFSVDGLKMEGTFDTATGTATATGIVETLTISDPALTSLILYPQEVAGGIVIRVLIDGQTYGCRLKNIEKLLPGMDYAITITVRKTGLSVSDCTITDWADSDLPDIEAGLVVPIGNKNASEAAVGDFYMKDGSLVDKDAVLTDKQTAACIGIVFTTDPSRIGESAKAALATKGIAPHGLVMALTNAADQARWGEDEIDESGLPNNTLVSAMYNDVDGYSETQWILRNHPDRLSDIYTAFYYTSLYGKTEDTSKFAAPAVSTDWFLPSAGNWWDILRNLGKADSLDGYIQSEEFTVSISNVTSAIVNNLNTHISGMENASVFVEHSFFWTSTEVSDSVARFIGLYSDGNLFISNYLKDHTFNSVRCVLAF